MYLATQPCFYAPFLKIKYTFSLLAQLPSFLLNMSHCIWEMAFYEICPEE